MKKLMFFLIGGLGLMLLGCGTPSGTTTTLQDEKYNPNDIVDPDQSISLIDHLRRVPGVQIDGNGPGASIRIRGINSLYGSSEPLFMLNGQQLDGGLQAAVQLIPVDQIKSISVLKNPGDTGIYGVRGANGVIEIYLK